MKKSNYLSLKMGTSVAFRNLLRLKILKHILVIVWHWMWMDVAILGAGMIRHVPSCIMNAHNLKFESFLKRECYCTICGVLMSHPTVYLKKGQLEHGDQIQRDQPTFVSALASCMVLNRGTRVDPVGAFQMYRWSKFGIIGGGVQQLDKQRRL